MGRTRPGSLHAIAHHGWTDRLRLILISALQVDKAVFFSALITVAGFVPLFTMQGVEGQIFGPMARTYGYALAGALIATFTSRRCSPPSCCPSTWRKPRRLSSASLAPYLHPTLRFALATAAWWCGDWRSFWPPDRFCRPRGSGSEFLPALEEGNFWIRASMPMTLSLQDGEAATRKMRLILLRHPEVITVVPSMAGPITAATLRRSPMSNCSCRSSR
jgi:cobalt-zinc-cadmium resistance protein CzcA